MNLWDNNVCDMCHGSRFFENGTCNLCSKKFTNCNHCDADRCLECTENFILKDDGLCWEDHCAEYLEDRRDFCVACELDADGHQWLLDENTGMCVESCDDDKQLTDLQNNVCRKLCAVNEYYDFENPSKCIPCNSFVSETTNLTYCNACWEVDGIIRPKDETMLYCDDCGDILRPTSDQLSCEHKWCEEVDPRDELYCEECFSNYYRAIDTTRCWKTCPLDDYEVFEKDMFTERTCAVGCEDNEFLSYHDKECHPCNDEIDGCNSCEFNFEEDSVVCLSCVDGLYPTLFGDSCTICPPGMILEGEDCVYCSDLIENCDECQRDMDGSIECGKCLGNSWLYDNECMCEYVEFLKESDSPSNRSQATCELCNREIPQCNICENQIVNIMDEGFLESELFISLIEMQQNLL